jgi:hypothetical protein
LDHFVSVVPELVRGERAAAWRVGFRVGVTLALALCLWGCPARAEQAAAPPPPAKQVLHLASYHHGYQWTDDIQAGLDEALRGPGQRHLVALQVEYLDAKRVFDETHQQNMARLLRHKYAGRDLDLVVTSDDDAFEFMKRFGGELFPGAPWVFCGVNNFGDERVAGLSNLTGVAEDVDFQATLEAVLRLFPRTRRLAVVGDSSTVGQQNLQALMAVWPAWAERLEMIHLRDRKSTRLNSSHNPASRMPSSA